MYEYVAPTYSEELRFKIPVWVEDARTYANGDAIHVLIVGENATRSTLKAALQTPTGVNTADSNASNNQTILRKSFDTYVSGRIYDLEVRDSDDPGYAGKIKVGGVAKALNVEKMPIAQPGQVTGYNMGLKLGYRVYFDFKTKGISNNAVKITPKIYYVSGDNSVHTTDSSGDISLFYRTRTGYAKLSASDLEINMIMSSTHGAVNNSVFTVETVTARQINPTRSLVASNTIGKIVGGLTLKKATEKMAYENIDEEAELLGFVNASGKSLSGDFIASAGYSNFISDVDPNRINDIKSATGHWYGEYYLPASTVVVSGNDKNTEAKDAMPGSSKILTSGYLVVAFDEITTGTNSEGTGYLSYAAPAIETQWTKEKSHQEITLPNSRKVTIPTQGESVAIYQVNLRANNDYETAGTH